MSVYRHEKRKEKRQRKGLRRGIDGHVIPPSVGKRHVELDDKHLFNFVDFFDFVKEHEDRVRVVLAREQWGGPGNWSKPLERLVQVYNSGGNAALVKRGFPKSFILEMDDDDSLEFIFWLHF